MYPFAMKVNKVGACVSVTMCQAAQEENFIDKICYGQQLCTLLAKK